MLARGTDPITGEANPGGFPIATPVALSRSGEPRSTSKSPPIAKLRPVSALTRRSMSGRNQFQSNFAISNPVAAASVASAATSHGRRF